MVENKSMLSVDIEKKLNDFTLRVKFEAGDETIALLGESGCGKSMTLRCIAGLEKPDRGHIELDGEVLYDSSARINLPPGKRNVGYLFQSYALFPNMNVRENVACGLRGRSDHIRAHAVDTEDMGRNSDGQIVEAMLRKLQIGDLADRAVTELSGGEQQRVALARMLVSRPRLLLLDEPFSALDSQNRFFLENEVRALLSELRKPAILVSHNRDEVYRMAGKTAIMHRGRLDTFGSVKEVFRNPGTAYGAAMTGCKNIAAAYPEEDGSIYVPEFGLRLQLPEGALTNRQIRYVGIRMHDIHIVPSDETGQGADNLFHAVVAEVIENPFSFTIMIRPGDGGEDLSSTERNGAEDLPSTERNAADEREKNGMRPMGMELTKEEWHRYSDRKELLLTIPRDRILLFER